MTRTIVYAISLAVFAVGGYWLRGAEFGGGKLGAAAVKVVTTASKKPKNCPGSTCDTDVTVAFEDSCPTDCWIAVLDDVLVVKKGTTISWNLKHEKFKFAADGIAFDASSGITCTAGPKKVDCTTGSTPGSFKYTVNLVGQGGTQNPPPLDPYVVNN